MLLQLNTAEATH